VDGSPLRAILPVIPLVPFVGCRFAGCWFVWLPP
jgi:hypothetical protein